MDDELAELQRQFEFAQEAKSSIRLSDRNVVELVQKLQELRIIDFDLLHTVSGKEYITPDQLRHEIVVEIDKLGRVSLIDLADTIGVDLYYVEKHAHQIVLEEPGLMLIQGEVISQSYWDSVAEEINDRLQESSQIALAELAAQLQVGSELIASMLEPRLGTLVKGRLEGGQLYTPAYVARVSAMVRGASRAITVPTNLSAVWTSLQQLLQDMDGTSGVAVDSSFFQSLFNGLLKEGEILGSLRAGVHWTPTVFAVAQKEGVDSFFSQNSFINYGVLQNLGIPQPPQYLKSRYPEGIALIDVFVHPSLIEMLDAATEDALERGSWIDALSVLPASFGSQDASKLLSLCPSVQLALKSNKAVIFGESYLFSDGFLKAVYDRVEKDMESFSVSGSSGAVPSDVLSDTKIGHDSSRITDSNEAVNEMSSNKQTTEKGSKKKRGKSSGTAAASATENSVNVQENPTSKSKKSQKKGKDTSLQFSDSKASVKKESSKIKEENNNIPSEEWVMQKISVLASDFEEQGIDDPETIIRPLANYLRPKLVEFWKQRRKALFTENAEKMKSVLDNLQKKLDESFLNMQLYEKALDLFEDDQSTSVILHRHLLRTTAAAIADTLIYNLDMHTKLKNGVEVEESQDSDSVSLSSGERIAIVKSFPGSLSNMAFAVVEALEGKRVDTFMTALRALAEESGLNLRKLDKKLERTLLHSYRKDLISQVPAETDPVSLLPKVVSLLYIQLHHKALQAPGRAILVAITRLKDKLDDSAYKILTEYQAATVTLLALISASTGDNFEQTGASGEPNASTEGPSFKCFSILITSAGETWLSIDCGARTPSVDALTFTQWVTDDKYIKTGENKLLSTPTNLFEMSTLRSFPKLGNSNNNSNSNKYCYNLPLKSQSKYLVRAGFYYGNYDNLKKPPTFNLQLRSGSVNVKVTTSLDLDPIYHEFIIFTTESSDFDVCLVETQEDEVPFISTLEATIIHEQEVYRDRFVSLVEKYNRIWKPQEDPRYLSSQFGPNIPISYSVEENNPPDVVINSLIEAHNASQSIVLPINFRQKSQVLAYFILYFDVTAAYKPLEEPRTVSISIDGKIMNTTQLPGFLRGEVVSIFPIKVNGGVATLSIASVGATTSTSLPPPAILNAMEVFSVLDVSDVGRSSVVGSSFSLVMLLLMLYCTDVEIRLDKALVSHLWLQSFPQATLTNGDFSSSDHTPISLEPKPPWLPKKTYHFRYENCWSREPLCSKLVEECWNNNHHISLAERIKACGIALDSWGQTLTGEIKAISVCYGMKIHVCHVKRKNIPNFVFSDGVCAQPDKSDENKTVLDGANQGRKRRHNGENNIRNVKSSGEVVDISSVTSSSMKCLAANIRYQNGDTEVSSSSSPPTKTSPKTLADKMDIEKVKPGSYAPHQAVLEELEDDLEHRNKVKSSENEAGVPPSATLVAPPLSNKCFASSVPHPKPIIRFIITSLSGRSS
uniref:Uncharacterized protein n=1 Tax=Cannabis sativa TaxID=3483 RepID=A0A803PWE6_CANSA